MVYIQCKKLTCFFHKTRWHHERTCQDYDRRMENTDRRTQRYLNLHTKTYPECNGKIEKIDGCHHMTYLTIFTHGQKSCFCQRQPPI